MGPDFQGIDPKDSLFTALANDRLSEMFYI